MRSVMAVIERELGRRVEAVRDGLPPGVQVAGRAEYDSLGFVTVSMRVVDVLPVDGSQHEVGVVGLYGKWEDVIAGEAPWSALEQAARQVVACWMLTNLSSALYVEMCLG